MKLNCITISLCKLIMVRILLRILIPKRKLIKVFSKTIKMLIVSISIFLVTEFHLFLYVKFLINRIWQQIEYDIAVRYCITKILKTFTNPIFIGFCGLFLIIIMFYISYLITPYDK